MACCTLLLLLQQIRCLLCGLLALLLPLLLSLPASSNSICCCLRGISCWPSLVIRRLLLLWLVMDIDAALLALVLGVDAMCLAIGALFVCLLGCMLGCRVCTSRYLASVRRGCWVCGPRNDQLVLNGVQPAGAAMRFSKTPSPGCIQA
jgi:hypothetical protein